MVVLGEGGSMLSVLQLLHQPSQGPPHLVGNQRTQAQHARV